MTNYMRNGENLRISNPRKRFPETPATYAIDLRWTLFHFEARFYFVPNQSGDYCYFD